MGQLVNGVWQDVWYDTASTKGRFERMPSRFRNWITADGRLAPPEKEDSRLNPAAIICMFPSPAWAHRTLMVRKLKGLESFIDVSVVHPLMLEHGWTFDTDFPAATGDALFGLSYLYQLYVKAAPNYTGRVTVPVLWDKQTNTIVNNESSDIIRMFNDAFNGIGAQEGDYYTTELREQIDDLNAWIYPTVNNGVYRAGFATQQDAYLEAVESLFQSLDTLEERLSRSRFLTGSRLTEADIRLWTTLLRFDPVYVTHFKCDKKRISDYPNLYGFLRDIYQIPGIAETVSIDHIRHHYYRSHKTINPTGIISIGPQQNLNEPTLRATLGESR